LEKRGTPTTSICTEEFAKLGGIQAHALKMPHLSILTIRHPLGGLKPKEVQDRAELAAKKFLNENFPYLTEE